jgi:hypothetical protein
MHSHRAMSGDVQPVLPQANATLGDVELRQATGLSRSSLQVSTTTTTGTIIRTAAAISAAC